MSSLECLEVVICALGACWVFGNFMIVCDRDV